MNDVTRVRLIEMKGPEDICKHCGHKRKHHDYAGCMYDPEQCQCPVAVYIDGEPVFLWDRENFEEAW